MMRESDRLYEICQQIHRLYEICQQFHQKVDHYFEAELEAFGNGDKTAAEINGAARLAWLDAWQIIIDHMRQVADSLTITTKEPTS